ncbi:MAG TPA: hypothetical protein VEY92_02785 [Pseudoxanthomonas sp.]|nr:hypothetical protein [Pseudoxanthomonas sp.]
MNEKAYVILNLKHQPAGEVPSDLRGLDRMQYSSFSELQSSLEKILSQEFPIKPTHDVENQLETLRKKAVSVVNEAPEGLKINDIASLLGVSGEIAKVLVYPLVGTTLRTEGVRKGTKYFSAATKELPAL